VSPLPRVGKNRLLAADWIENGPYWLKASDPHFVGALESEVEKDIEVGVSESFGDAKILEGKTLLPTLRELVYFVDELVLKFRPLLKPLE
jgi:hypothetical protein